MSRPLVHILVAVGILVITVALTMYQLRYNEASSLVMPDFMVVYASPEWWQPTFHLDNRTAEEEAVAEKEKEEWLADLNRPLGVEKPSIPIEQQLENARAALAERYDDDINLINEGNNMSTK